MLNYIVKNKVTKDGVIIGILLNNGIETRFVPKEKFSYFSDRVFVNAKISLDGKITATKGKIPVLDYKDYISERNKVLTKDKNNMVLYHGSPDIIEKPSFGYGNKRNDYGVGFYCTQNIELGREWACSKNPNGILNTYILKKEGLNVLNLSHRTKEDVLTWFSILISNRIIKVRPGTKKDNIETLRRAYLPKNYRSYDVIVGYRADDSYFSYAMDFAMGNLSLEGLSDAMFLGGLGLQVVLISKKAFSNLLFIDYEQVDSGYRRKFESRDKQARNGYFKYKDIGKVFVEDIVRELKSNGKM